MEIDPHAPEIDRNNFEIDPHSFAIDGNYSEIDTRKITPV
jgi:hypothetical protein